MNAQLHRTSRVYISLVHNGQRFWLGSVGNARAGNGTLFLRGDWNTDASQARSYTFEIAEVIRRRLSDQGVPPTELSQTAGDLAEFIED